MDAIEYFKGMRKVLCEEYLKGIPKDSVGYQTTLREMSFYELAIKALEQQPCDDCISRQAVLDGLASIAKVKARSDAQKSLMGRIMFFVEQLPPVTPKEKTGRWIQGEIDGQIVRAFTCSKCGAISIFRVSNGNIVNGDLCPNCGAKMEEVEE